MGQKDPFNLKRWSLMKWGGWYRNIVLREYKWDDRNVSNRNVWSSGCVFDWGDMFYDRWFNIYNCAM
jgi:hypothetical protein